MRHLLNRFTVVIVMLSVLAGLTTAVPAARAASGWLLTGPMQPASYSHTPLVTLHDGRVLAAPFNAGSGQTTARADIYDPATNSWGQTSQAILSHGYEAPVVLADGRVLFTGGLIGVANAPSSSYTINASQIYDPLTNQWTPVAPMLQSHSGQTATLLADGTVLVVGGVTIGGPGDSGYRPTADAERYDPRTNTWTRVGAELEPRVTNSVVRLHDGGILVVGGKNGDGEVIASAELFNPAMNSWSSAGSMSTARDEATATVLPDGKVLVAGGTHDVSTAVPLSSTDIFDPATNQWAAGPSMTVARAEQASALLHNGTVLVAGGFGPEQPGYGFPLLAGCEIYDPTTNSWASAPAMPARFNAPTAVVIGSGAVLVLGGTTARSAAANRGALYVPQLPGPTERQLPPGGPLPSNRIYFSQTGHYVVGGFLAYWQHFGGLAVFGYPITEEFEQNGLTVQYFQRARFEWHPGAWPSHYDVELSLLGTELVQRQGLLGTAAFERVSASSDVNCTFYPQTGHRLCFGFRAYWQSHGGLAIFGYPISEEFTDPTTGLTVQYFQRQRFEYHPNNPPGWQVEGGLLGTELLNASGQ